MKSIKSCSICGESLLTKGWATFKTGNICCSCFNHTIRHHFHVGSFSLTITQVPEYFRNLSMDEAILNILMPIIKSEDDTFASDICAFACALSKYEVVFGLGENVQLGSTTKRILNKYINHAYSNPINIDDMFKAVNILLIVKEICRFDKDTKYGKKIFIELRNFIVDLITINWLTTNNMAYYELASHKAYLCQYLGRIQTGNIYIDHVKHVHRVYNILSTYLNIWWAYNYKYDVVHHGTKLDKGHNVVSYDHDIKWENEAIALNFIDDNKGE